MRLHLTFSRYMIRQFLWSFIIVAVGFTTLIMMIDALETLRRASSHDVPFFAVIEMVLLNLPAKFMEVLPFIVLIANVLSLSRLSRSHELIVARASGISVWQFLLPNVFAGFVIGLFAITALNPLTCALLRQHERLEAKYIRGQTQNLTISSSGLWLRQKDNDGDTIVHARTASSNGQELRNATIIVFDQAHHFKKRYDVKVAKLNDVYWQLSDAIITTLDSMGEKAAHLRLPTSLTLEQIQDSFADPKTMSFWELPGFIQNLRDAGFSAQRHLLQWLQLLATPLYLAAMTLVAAIFSLHLPRRSRSGLLIVASFVAGFAIFIIRDISGVFGVAGQIPMFVAVFVPVAMISFLSLALLLHIEDG